MEGFPRSVSVCVCNIVQCSLVMAGVAKKRESALVSSRTAASRQSRLRQQKQISVRVNQSSSRSSKRDSPSISPVGHSTNLLSPSMGYSRTYRAGRTHSFV